MAVGRATRACPRASHPGSPRDSPRVDLLASLQVSLLLSRPASPRAALLPSLRVSPLIGPLLPACPHTSRRRSRRGSPQRPHPPRRLP
jgi:hypothetical protein